MSLDDVRAGSSRARSITVGATGAKHTALTVGVGSSAHVLDAKTSQVALFNNGTLLVVVSFDGGAAALATDWPLPAGTGQTFNVVGGGTLNLIAAGAGQDVRVLESLVD